MATYAISDLHLSFGTDKPMNVFGNVWLNYEEKVKENWIKQVKEKDIVILPGDLSWGITLKEAKKDFEFIHHLPGKKIIIKGNHDYYFPTKTKIESFFDENNLDTIAVLFNNAIDTEEYIIAGTRGWGKTEPSDKKLDKKIIEREEGRLIISLEMAKKLQAENGKEIIVAMHFPPFIGKFQEIMKQYGVKTCVYGHLHGYGHCMIKEGIIDGIEYKMVSCDYTKFKLIQL
ncbi:MAG: metallophosphoesterase [Clostridia bacterium]|nr:metallophosphoesterase [Clostridia bacterium]